MSKKLSRRDLFRYSGVAGSSALVSGFVAFNAKSCEGRTWNQNETGLKSFPKLPDSQTIFPEKLGKLNRFKSTEEQFDFGRIMVPSMTTPKKVFGDQHSDHRNYLCIYDFKEETCEFIETPLKRSHLVLSHPKKENHFIVVERNGPHYAEVDIEKMTVTKHFRADEGFKSWGHVIFSPDGRYMLSSEAPDTKNGGKEGFGCIQVRDSLSYEPVEKLSSHGYNPHDFVFTSDNRGLAICNMGRYKDDSSFVQLSYPSGAIVRKMEMPSKKWDGSHVHLCPDGEFMVTTSHRIPYDNNEHEFRRFGRPMFAPAPVLFTENKNRFIQSDPGIHIHNFQYTGGVVFDYSRGVACTTHMYGHAASFWDFKRKKFVRMEYFGNEHPHGMTLNQSKTHWVIITIEGSFHFIDADTLRRDPSLPQAHRVGFGQHLRGSAHITPIPSKKKSA